MHCWVIIAAAGKSLRLALAGLERPKQFLTFDGVPLYWHSARAFSHVSNVRGLVLVFPPALLDEAAREVKSLIDQERFSLPCLITAGGEERQDSVRNALAVLPKECDAVLVHDAARPFMSATLAAAVLSALQNGHEAVIPGLAMVDTVKEVDGNDCVTATRDRKFLRAVQTPQGFSRAELEEAHKVAHCKKKRVTDDAALMEYMNIPVFVVPGEAANRKITTPEDLALLSSSASAAPAMPPRTGFGYDVHAYGGNRPLILGGVPIPTDLAVFAHSDGDVLLHALMDAILGCLGRGDIGALFPDSDPALAGIAGGVLLNEVLHLAQEDGFVISHADLTLVAQVPKIAPYRENIAANVAKLLALPKECVNVKATTEEHLGFTGEKKGIKAYAIVNGTMRGKNSRSGIV
ncbi:bifunctional enzyme IspD/IspF [Deltaproteobacteria bacterium]|nr:bifunctional enzyme IspD/IspF [Deltaproteobacteria bacterium]